VWTDSHCHIGVEAIAPARAAGVIRFINVGTDEESSAAAVSLASREDGVWATVGLHPHDAVQGLSGVVALLESVYSVGRSPSVVAVGECGLDYHYDHSPRPVQRSVFASQVALAQQLGLALVIHTRESWDDTFAILRSEGVPDRTVFHCFTGGPTEARKALDLGAALSFSGIVTFRSAADVRDAARLCPLERLLVETDSPYLAPVPFRGKPNSPALVPVVGAAVAATRGLADEVIEEASWVNSTRLFQLTDSARPDA
jgi:TatD DNase family protein